MNPIAKWFARLTPAKRREIIEKLEEASVYTTSPSPPPEDIRLLSFMFRKCRRVESNGVITGFTIEARCPPDRFGIDSPWKPIHCDGRLLHSRQFDDKAKHLVPEDDSPEVVFGPSCTGMHMSNPNHEIPLDSRWAHFAFRGLFRPLACAWLQFLTPLLPTIALAKPSTRKPAPKVGIAEDNAIMDKWKNYRQHEANVNSNRKPSFEKFAANIGLTARLVIQARDRVRSRKKTLFRATAR